MKIIQALFLLLILFFAISCFFEKTEKEEVLHYLFTGHCYQWGAKDWDRSDYRIEKLNVDTFDQIWLGGDLVENMFHKSHTINYVDSLFNVGSETTLWAIGNHDVLDQNGDFSKIEDQTHRKTFYSTHSHGITYLVLNTTEFHFPTGDPSPSICELFNEQMRLIKNVTDTIQEASHLVILHHHALLTNEIAKQQVDVQKVFNYYYPLLNMGCEERGSFTELVYPRLLEVQKRGVQVILVGGDTGQQVKEFEFQTEEGIIFLGSGLNNSAGIEEMPTYFSPAPDKVLIFSHQPKLRKLEWEFRILEKILEKE